jgi:hypothetical protein
MLWSSSVTNNHNHSLDCHHHQGITSTCRIKICRNYPRQQLAQILNQDQNRNVGSKVVYNANLQARNELFWTQTPLQVLIDLATEKDYLTKFNLGDTGNLTHAFFVIPMEQSLL